MSESASGRPTAYQLFMLGLCLYAILALAAQQVLQLPPDVHAVLQHADNVVCVLFLADFLVSLKRAPRKWEYLVRWGWIDLLSSIPTVDILRFGRFARILRIFRVLRGAKAMKVVGGFVLQRRAQGAFLAAALIAMLLVVFSSIAVLIFENVPGSNITTAEDAIWWAVATITSVGYGDYTPVTSEGRVVATMLMTAGVGLFGAVSGFVASWLLTPDRRTQQSELDDIRQELSAIRGLLERG